MKRVGAVLRLLSRRQRVAAVAGLALVLAVGAALVVGGGDSAPDPDQDACNLLSTRAVADALGAPSGRVAAVPRPPDPEGDRCNYEDTQSRMLLFFVRVEESDNPSRARQLVETLPGTPVAGVGEVARFAQTSGRSQMSAFAHRRWVFMTSVTAALPQEKMSVLARRVISNFELSPPG